MLGLSDVNDSNCDSYIMSMIRYNASTGTYNNRTVQSDECARADSINETPAEVGPQPPQTDPTDPTTCHNCGQPGPEPLILDLDGDGIALTGIDDPVIFDLDGNGSLDITSWTARDTDDAFLFYDLDNDGFVDGGRELFGSATATHSFAALAKLDWEDNGGNADGIIDHRDRAWARLRLWIDLDHDGNSVGPGEIVTLQSRHIKYLDLAYSEIRRADSKGNRLDYRGTYVKRSGASETYWDMYGVTFSMP